MTQTFFRFGLLAALLVLPISAHADPDQKPSVTVSGEASISRAPDLAILSAGVSSQAKTARDAMAASAKLMTAVLAALKESGVAERDIQTSRIALNPIREQKMSSGGTGNIIAIEASSLLTVRIRDINKSADVLDKMVSAGANLVTGIGFEISEPSKLLDEARAEAVADARRKAEIYAKAAGVTLGKPLSISESFISRPKMQDYAMRAAPAAMPIQAGEEKIGINVQVSYELMH